MNLKTEMVILIERYLLENNFKSFLIPIVVSQFAHETGNFTSKIFLDNHNPSGMKLAKVRPKTAIGENLGHAKYTNLRDGVKDFKFYFDYVKLSQVPYTIEGYCQALKKKGYFEDSIENYTKGVEYFYNLYYA